ncbi:MAG: hypothetical protein KDA70_07720 [Planctomycetaceae bacterium]|nr:hypothetical protein [Planctomycetaceae bacterium]
MLSRPYITITCLITLIALIIGWELHSSKSDPETATPANRRAVVKRVKVKKPVLQLSQPVDWNRPINITCLETQLEFPLSFSPGDDYILIVNNLDRSPRHTKTIRLSIQETAGDQPENCYFENTQEPDSTPQASSLLNASIPYHSSDTGSLVNEPKSDAAPIESVRYFYLFVTEGDLSDKKQYTRLKARLIQQSPRVAIYLDDQQKPEELAAGLVNDLIAQLENQVLDKIEKECGPLRDVDGNGRFTIFLTPWLSKLQGGKTTINGFVRPSDFRDNVMEPFSNHCDMLYLNSALKPGPQLLDLLSHEVTHAAVSSIRTTGTHSLPDEEDWLNEGIAHLMEPGYTNRDYRISEFFRSPESYPLVVSDYYRAQLWRNHGCRGAVNLFLNWCNQLKSDSRFANRFTRHRLTGTAKIEHLTSTPFPELFRLWSLDLARQSQAYNTLNSTGNTPEPLIYCGRFVLAGPAIHDWNLSDQNHTSLKIASTASGFVRLKSKGQLPEKRMIKVQGFQSMQLTLLKIKPTSQQVSLEAEYAPSENSVDSSSQFVEVQLRCSHPINSKVEKICLEFNGAYLSQLARQPQKRDATALDDSDSIEQRSGLRLVLLNSETQQNKQVTEFNAFIPRTSFEGKTNMERLSWKAIVISEIQQRGVAQVEMAFPSSPPRRIAKTVLDAAK